MDADAKQAIADRWAAFKEACESRDVEQWKSFWTRGMRILEPGMDMSGPEFMEFGRNFFESGGKVFSFDMESLEIFIHGDVAYQIGRYQESFQFPDQEPAEVDNHAFVRWEKEGGTWKISRLLAGPAEGPSEG